MYGIRRRKRSVWFRDAVRPLTVATSASFVSSAAVRFDAPAMFVVAFDGSAWPGGDDDGATVMPVHVDGAKIVRGIGEGERRASLLKSFYLIPD